MLFLLFLLPAIFAGPGDTYVRSNSLNYFTKMVSTFYLDAEGSQGIYMANQFNFVSGKVGYLGFQPRNSGPNRLVFSVFGDGPTSDSENCSDGADSGSGVSCATLYPWKHGQNNTIEMERTIVHDDESNTWRATFVDDVTGERVVFANYTTPASFGLLSGQGVHFDEWYPFNGDGKNQSERDCIPKAKIIAYIPTFYRADGTSVQSSLSSISHGEIGDGCEFRANKPNVNVTQIGPHAVQYLNGVLNDEYADE